LATESEAPPPPPLIQVEGIDDAGNETVPEETVKPLLKVGVELTVKVFVPVIPNVVFP
jgi:hypothetical protein